MFDLPSNDSFNNSPLVVQEYVIDSKNDTSWDEPLRYYAEKHLITMSDEELDQDWKLNEFFGTIAVINLPEAKERLQLITQELNEIGTKTFRVFKAINGRKELSPSIWKKIDSKRGKVNRDKKEKQEVLDQTLQAEAGCYMSHYRLIQSVNRAFEKAMANFLMAKATHDSEKIRKAEIELNKYKSVLVLEDDAGFGIVNKEQIAASKKGVGKLLREALRELPNDWDILYFLVHPTAPVEETSPHLRKLKKSWCCVAYAINYTMYAPVLQCLGEIEDPKVEKVWAFDHQISKIHHLHKSYAVFPALVFHQEGASQIKVVDNVWPIWQCQPVYPQPKDKLSKKTGPNKKPQKSVQFSTHLINNILN